MPEAAHFHIRWSSGHLDWQPFETRADAEQRARELVQQGETYTFELSGG